MTTLNDRKFSYFGDLGYTGSLSDREAAWRIAEGHGRGSLYSVYVDSGLSGNLNDMAYAFYAAWWNSFIEGGVAASLILDFKNDQYYNVLSKTLADLVSCARSTTKSAWDANGDIITVAANTPVQLYDPVTLANRGLTWEGTLNRINIRPKCVDGDGWADTNGATTTNLSLNALGVFDGASVSSGGTVSAFLQVLPIATLVSGSVYPFRVFYRAGTSGSVVIHLRNTVAVSDTDIGGTTGSISVIRANAGTISDLSEVLLADGVTYMASFYLTANGSSTYNLGIGPNTTTSGETVIALGAFIGAAGEPLPHCPIVGNDGSTVLIDADELSLITVLDGVELVPDGTFSLGNVDEWAVTGGSIAYDSGTMLVTATSNAFAYFSFTTVIGRTYRMSAEITAESASSFYGVRKSDNNTASSNVVSIQVGAVGSSTVDIVATATTTFIVAQVNSAASTINVDNISVQELVPFVGFSGASGTWLLEGQWEHNSAATAYMLAGDNNTRIVYQNAGDTALRSFDGTNSTSIFGEFTDNTGVKVAMSYLEGGRFNILADGSTENDDPLTGDMYIPNIDIGHLAGAVHIRAGILAQLVYWVPQFDEATRQGITS